MVSNVNGSSAMQQMQQLRDGQGPGNGMGKGMGQLM